jgi:hypothetical protein
MKKIVDNPSIKEVLDDINNTEFVFRFIKKIPGVSLFFPGLVEVFKKLEEIKSQANSLFIPDRFNEVFSEFGWIAYETLSVGLMEEAIRLAEENKFDEAEEYIADYYNEDNLSLLIRMFQSHKDFSRRLRLIELAKEDYLQERYHACVPLLLTLIDGLVRDISGHVGFFAEGSDMTVSDSVAAHESGLQAVFKIMSTSRMKTADERITIPYRHGIIHGRDLTFDNKLVAAKCWSTLFAIGDWTVSLATKRRGIKPEEKRGLVASLRRYHKIKQQRKKCNEWKPRNSVASEHCPIKGPADHLPEGTPERAVAEFIDNWAERRYGKLAELLMDGPPSKKAGPVRHDFGSFDVLGYRIMSVRDEAPAISIIDVEIEYSSQGKLQKKQVSIRAIYQDQKKEPLLRGEPGGSWKMIQYGFKDIIFKSNV